jgi:multicomponent Na+:H+ antiporter subunit B
VPLVNAAVGVEVASGVIVLIAQFLDQAVEIGSPGDGDGDGGGNRGGNGNGVAAGNDGPAENDRQEPAA